MKETYEQKLEKFRACADLLPGVVVIHELSKDDFTTVFMNSMGLMQLGVSLEDLKKMGSEYHEKFFNNEDMEDFMEKFHKLLHNNNPNETFTFFQQVKLKDKPDWTWHMASTRIFHQHPDGHPSHMITVAFPVDHMKHIPNKAERLLAENRFFKLNQNKYLSLGKRAREVLRLVALGQSSIEIAEELNISTDTVNTHRKNIKKKLGISTSYEFTEYARAFDLI